MDKKEMYLEILKNRISLEETGLKTSRKLVEEYENEYFKDPDVNFNYATFGKYKYYQGLETANRRSLEYFKNLLMRFEGIFAEDLEDYHGIENK